jgi:membrane protein
MALSAYLERLFRLDRHPVQASLARGKATVQHVVSVAVEKFQDDLLSLRAASLTYTTLLSLVPFLAVAFSVLKAFGVQNQLEPALAGVLAPLGPEAVEITRRVISFVDNQQVGVLGAVGVAGLFYTVLSLIGKIEDALNNIWRVRRPRSLGRQFSDYLSVVLVGPVLVFTALALTASAQSHWLVQRFLEFKPLGWLVPLLTRLTPLILLCGAFTFVYQFIPHTHVRLRSALVGGVVAGLLWQVAGVGFTTFVASSASYAAVYSSFAILILFLIWLQLGWMIVLVGAEVAYYHQHPGVDRQGVSRGGHSPLFREQLALAMLVELTRHSLGGKPPTDPAQLAATLGVPLASLEELIEGFVRRGLLLRAAEPAGITLGRLPEQIPVVEILDTLRGAEAPAPARGGEEQQVVGVLQRRDQAVRHALEGLTLRALASEPTLFQSSHSPGELCREPVAVQSGREK